MYKQNYDVIPNVNAIAITNHPSSLGLPLKVDYTDNNITYIYLSVANKNFNYFNKIREKANMLPETRKDKIVSFHSSY